MKRVWIVGVVAVVAMVGFAAFIWTDRPEPAATPIDANVQTQVFLVEQMTCATCPITVRTAMAAVAGVTSVAVDFETKRATVTFDPMIATPRQIAEASTNAGYPASPLS